MILSQDDYEALTPAELEALQRGTLEADVVDHIRQHTSGVCPSCGVPSVKRGAVGGLKNE